MDQTPLASVTSSARGAVLHSPTPVTYFSEMDFRLQGRMRLKPITALNAARNQYVSELHGLPVCTDGTVTVLVTGAAVVGGAEFAATATTAVVGGAVVVGGVVVVVTDGAVTGGEVTGVTAVESDTVSDA